MLSQLITLAEESLSLLIKKAHDIDFYQGRNADSCWDKVFALWALIKEAEGLTESLDIENKLRCYIDPVILADFENIDFKCVEVYNDLSERVSQFTIPLISWQFIVDGIDVTNGGLVLTYSDNIVLPSGNIYNPSMRDSFNALNIDGFTFGESENSWYPGGTFDPGKMTFLKITWDDTKSWELIMNDNTTIGVPTSYKYDAGGEVVQVGAKAPDNQMIKQC